MTTINTNCGVKHLGFFKVRSGRLNITDPCYSTDVWCRGDVPVVNGDWCGQAEMIEEEKGFFVKSLSCWSVNVCSPDTIKRKQALFKIGVDSGQAGIFDLDEYPRFGASFSCDGEDNDFYRRCCETSLKRYAGVIEMNGNSIGVVSRSGYGDGGYKATLWVNGNGLVEEIEINFIEDGEKE